MDFMDSVMYGLNGLTERPWKIEGEPLKSYKLKYKDDDENYIRVYTMDVPGKNVNDIDVVEQWVNRYKELSLVVTIKDREKFVHQESIKIDTNIYESYKWDVVDGVLTITLGEIINERPKFKRVY